jgi:hypothetical protein
MIRDTCEIDDGNNECSPRAYFIPTSGEIQAACAESRVHSCATRSAGIPSRTDHHGCILMSTDQQEDHPEILRVRPRICLSLVKSFGNFLDGYFFDP